MRRWVMEELFASFGLAMLTGILCIYIVLVPLFKDFLHPSPPSPRCRWAGCDGGWDAAGCRRLRHPISF